MIGNLGRFLTESNLFISICSTAFCASAYWYFGNNANPLILAFVFFATLFTYNFQRMVGISDDPDTNKYLQLTLVGIAAFALGFIVWRLSLQAIVLLATAGLLSVGYAIRFVPWRHEKVSLRQLPYLKLPVIVITWLIAVVLVPFFEEMQSIGIDSLLSLLLLTLQQGSLVAVIAICFDIRDLPFDEASQRTLPQRHGIEGAIRIGKMLIWVSAAAASVNYLLGNFTLAGVVIALLVLPFLWKVLKGAHPGRSAYYFELLADGILLLPAIGFLMFRLAQILGQGIL